MVPGSIGAALSDAVWIWFGDAFADWFPPDAPWVESLAHLGFHAGELATMASSGGRSRTRTG